jgi:hypothetical protein
VARLHALGTEPINPALQSAHLTAIAGVRSGSVFGRSLAGRLKVGAGVLAGFLLGATGLTTVGAMGPLQPIAATAVEAVTPINVPHGAKDKAADAQDKADKASRLDDGSIGTQRQWTGCVAGDDGTFAGNRGLYLKQERAKGTDALAAAKASDCGKPVAGDDDAPETEKPEATETEKSGAQFEGAGKSDGQGAQPDSAGKSGIDPSAPETPAEPDTPAPSTDTAADQS